VIGDYVTTESTVVGLLFAGIGIFFVAWREEAAARAEAFNRHVLGWDDVPMRRYTIPFVLGGLAFFAIGCAILTGHVPFR
jgi:hypothetical protein